MKLRWLLILTTLAFTLSTTPLVKAQIIPNPDNRNDVSQQRLLCRDSNGVITPCPNDSPVGGGFGPSIQALWARVLTILYLVLGGVAALMLVYSGIQYILSGSQPETAKKARQNLINTFLGLVLLTGSYAIIRIIVGISNGLVVH